MCSTSVTLLTLANVLRVNENSDGGNTFRVRYQKMAQHTFAIERINNASYAVYL